MYEQIALRVSKQNLKNFVRTVSVSSVLVTTIFTTNSGCGFRMETRVRDNSWRGIRQLVKKPTHAAGHTLDLVLTDMGSGVTVKVAPGIHERDHYSTVTKLQAELPLCENQTYS